MVQSEHYRKHLPASAWMLLGVREEDELLYVDEMKALERANPATSKGAFHWVPCVSRPKSEGPFFSGRVTNWLRAQGDAFPWKETEYYLCGGSAMIDEVKQILAERGVEKHSIHQEIYYREPKA